MTKSQLFPTFSRVIPSFRMGKLPVPSFGDSTTSWKSSSLILWDSREQIELTLLEWINSALRYDMNLAELMDRLSMEYRGLAKSHIQRFASHLRCGKDIALSAELSPALFSPSSILALQFGTQTNSLAEVLRNHTARVKSNVDLSSDKEKIQFGYWVFLSVMLIVCCAFLTYAVVPMFQSFYRDLFDLTSPPATRLSVVSGFVIRYSPLLLALVIAACVLLFSPWLSNWLGRNAPWIRSAQSNFSTHGDVYWLLEDAVSQGIPLQLSLSTLAKFHPHDATRRRLLIARNDIELGTPVWEALGETGLLRARESAGLSQSDDPSWQALILSNVAKRTSRNQFVNRGVRVILLETLLTLFFGVIVLVVVWSFWITLYGVPMSLS